MKLSNTILATLMLAGASATAQTDTVKVDSIQVLPDCNLNVRSERTNSTYYYLDGIKIQREQTVGPAGELIIVERPRRRICYACGMG